MAVPTIASIELVNFMCHRNFAVSFTKMVSCVSGRNGSGKSAVMIALGVLFGQRAHALERGSSFKNLIRAGSNQALIRVTLNNHRWHCTAKYGPVITLEKRLRPTGSRLVYVVEGRAHDMSAQNMRDLLMAYGLRFENPLNFLTQEQSKRFLNLSNPAELYDFYYCGSEFKTINAEIEEGLARLEEMEGMIEQTNEAYERVGKELELKRGQLEFLCTDFEARLAELAVEEEAVRLAGLLEEHKQAWGGIRAAEDEIGAAEEQRRAAEDAIENVAFVEKSTAAVDAEIEGLELRKHGLANDCADYVKELEETESAIRRIKERSRAESLSSSIQEADRRCSQQTAELEQLEGELGKQLAIDAEKEKETNDKISKRRYALDQQIRFLKNNTRDSAVEEVLAEHRRVAREMRTHQFRDRVIGPVCDLVGLKDQRWYKPVSIVLKRSLDTYLVFNQQDRQRLIEIFKKAGVNFSISLLSTKEPVPRSFRLKNSMADVLEVREEIVMSLLNSFHSIDQIMLIEDRERAYQIVKRGDHDGARVDCAYTPEGDRIKLTNGSLSDFKARDSGSFWFESSKEKLAALEREMGQLAVTNAAQKRLREHESRLRTLRESHAAAETALSSMRAKFDSISQLKENSTEDYERKQAALARRVSVAQSKLGEAQQALEQRHEARRQIDRENEVERVRVATRKAEMQGNLCNFDLQIARSSQKKRDLISKKNMLDREVATRIDAMLSGKENSGKENCRGKGEEPGLSQTSGNLLRLPDKYRKLVEAPRSLVDVLGDKAAINEHIRTRDKMRSQSDIRNDISVLMKERSVHAKIKNKFSMAISETHAACMKRQTKRDEIKDIKTAEASALFAEYTARAGYEGTLKFDHAQGLLDLRMKVHNASVAGSKSTLSGGERSFAGVCFLLSLWRSFQCPVKILDEFDVFMDPLNRKAAIRSLLEFFKENEMQAILITPLSTDDLRSCDVDIKVLTKEE